jgi:hypothetical protein
MDQVRCTAKKRGSSLLLVGNLQQFNDGDAKVLCHCVIGALCAGIDRVGTSKPANK